MAKSRKTILDNERLKKMAKTINSIKKLEQAGGKIVFHQTGHNERYTVKFPAGKVDVYGQDDEVLFLDVHRNGAEDDLMTDYHAGSFCENITAAIRLAKRMELVK